MYKSQLSRVRGMTKFQRVNVVVPFIFKEADFEEEESLPQEDLLSKDDLELIRRSETFKKEALPHLAALHNFANKMLRDKPDSDDLTQETYLKAFQFFNTYEKGTNCRAWLFKIMKNLMINKFRKELKEPATVSYEDVEDFISSIKSNHFDTDDVQQIIFSKLMDDEMTIALNSMHDNYKIVVILCDLECLSYEEIAEFLNCPIGTVRSRLHRGRRLLQKKLFSYAKQRGYNVNSVN